jgi:hypothetical protein
MSNHEGSRQNNFLLQEMLQINLFDKISKEDSVKILSALRHVEDGNEGEIYEGIPESLNYCVMCSNFKDRVKYFESWGITMCKECATKYNEDFPADDA